MTTLSVKECLTYGWQTFKNRPWLFVQAGILLFLINLAVSLVQTLMEYAGGLGGDMGTEIAMVMGTFLGCAVSFLTSMGETAFFLKSHDAVSQANLKDLWHPQPFWKFVGVSVLVGVIVFVGLILLIVPGIIAGILFGFATYLVIDKGLAPIEALKKSMELTKGNRWNLFFLGLALLGINILGLIAAIVGLLVTIPVSFLAMTHAYRTLAASEVQPVLEGIS